MTPRNERPSPQVKIREVQRCSVLPTGQAHLPLEALIDRVLDALPDGREDDVVVLAVRMHPEGGPRPV